MIFCLFTVRLAGRLAGWLAWLGSDIVVHVKIWNKTKRIPSSIAQMKASVVCILAFCSFQSCHFQYFYSILIFAPSSLLRLDPRLFSKFFHIVVVRACVRSCVKYRTSEQRRQIYRQCINLKWEQWLNWMREMSSDLCEQFWNLIRTVTKFSWNYVESIAQSMSMRTGQWCENVLKM